MRGEWGPRVRHVLNPNTVQKARDGPITVKICARRTRVQHEICLLILYCTRIVYAYRRRHRDMWSVCIFKFEYNPVRTSRTRADTHDAVGDLVRFNRVIALCFAITLGNIEIAVNVVCIYFGQTTTAPGASSDEMRCAPKSKLTNKVLCNIERKTKMYLNAYNSMVYDARLYLNYKLDRHPYFSMLSKTS